MHSLGTVFKSGGFLFNIRRLCNFFHWGTTFRAVIPIYNIYFMLCNIFFIFKENILYNIRKIHLEYSLS